MKKCICCGETKNYSEFPKHKQKPDGYYTYCKECKNVKDKLSYAKHKEKRYITQLNWNLENKEKVLAYKKKYRDNNKQKLKEWLLSNKDIKNKYSRQWKKDNKAKVLAETRKRQAAKLQRTPAWLTTHDYKVMESKYAIAAWLSAVVGIEYHVDHVIPLRGKNVSGLHVPDNLSVIPAKDNLEKSNKYGRQI